MSLTLSTAALAVPVGTSADTRTAAPQQRPGWQTGGVNLRFDANTLSGNVKLTNANVNLISNYNLGPHQIFLDLGRLYSATNTRVLVDRIAGSALYAYALKDDFNTYMGM